MSTKIDEDKFNGCIINAVNQISSDKIMVSVNKQNYTAEIFKNTKMANLSILTKYCPFEIFKRFGFQSGRNADKFCDFDYYALSSNGLPYITSLLIPIFP